MNRLDGSSACSAIASTSASKLPLFCAFCHAAVSSWTFSTVTPTWRHWSTRKMPSGVNGIAKVRLVRRKLRFGTPASCSRRRASARAARMSRPKPGICSSSSRVPDQNEPGGVKLPTGPMNEMRAIDAELPQRSIARLSARRTRTSLNGGRVTLKVTRQSCTQLSASMMRMRSPRAATTRSRSAGARPRNSAITCPPASALTIAAPVTITARKPSR